MGQILSQPIKGYQFRADGTGVTCHPGDLAAFLDEIVPAIGMTLVDGPFVSERHGQGIVIVAESHVWVGVVGSDAIAIVFSCCLFDRWTVLALLAQHFGGHWRSRYWVDRSCPPVEPKRSLLQAMISRTLGARSHRSGG